MSFNLLKNFIDVIFKNNLSQSLLIFLWLQKFNNPHFLFWFFLLIEGYASHDIVSWSFSANDISYFVFFVLLNFELLQASLAFRLYFLMSGDVTL